MTPPPAWARAEMGYPGGPPADKSKFGVSPTEAGAAALDDVVGPGEVPPVQASSVAKVAIAREKSTAFSYRCSRATQMSPLQPRSRRG